MKGFWLKKEECTGCGMCSNICPVEAISMECDICGFMYPHIQGHCVDCNLCEKACERRRMLSSNNRQDPDVYAAWSKDKETRFKSTSGGIFTELATWVLTNGGYVAGAAYNKDNLVEHILISDVKGLELIRQSKYIQSDTKQIYSAIGELLGQGKMVAFCGAPCQVAALHAYLGNRKYDNLYTFDFICRGMNSPKAYISWLKEIEKEYCGKIERVWFKYKEKGWKKSPKCTRIDFKDRSSVVLEQENNLFMCGYLTHNLYIRPSCGNCDFKGISRNSDITLADFWGIENELDDDNGVSLVIVNSPKGKLLIENICANIEIHKRSFEEILKGNVCFNNSVNISQESRKFLEDLDKYSFSYCLKLYSKKESKIKSMLKKLFVFR